MIVLKVAAFGLMAVAKESKGETLPFCMDAVSSSGEHKNEYCRKLCSEYFRGELGDNPGQLNNECQQEPYVFDEAIGHFIPQGACYGSWVFGYPAEMVGHPVGHTNSPALCQDACQHDDGCFRFSWLPGMTEADVNCYMLSPENVAAPAHLRLRGEWTLEEFEAADADDYCEFELDQLCADNSVKCKSCFGSTRCIYEDLAHITGPKYCGFEFEEDLCVMEQVNTNPIFKNRDDCQWKMELMIVQDTTYSFETNVERLQEQMPLILAGVEAAYPEPRYGFAVFKDKPHVALGWDDDFCFELRCSLTNDADEVLAAVNEIGVSGGYDWPEDQLDALYMAARDSKWTPGDQLSDENGRPYMRAVILITDAYYHEEGDGLVHGIELKPFTGGKDFCAEEDYVPIETLGDLLREQNIRPVFLIAEDPTFSPPVSTETIYKRLLNRLGVEGAVVSMEADGSDIVMAVTRGIAGLGDPVCREPTEEPEVTHPVPEQPIIPEITNPIIPEITNPIIPEITNPIIPEITNLPEVTTTLPVYTTTKATSPTTGTLPPLYRPHTPPGGPPRCQEPCHAPCQPRCPSTGGCAGAAAQMPMMPVFSPMYMPMMSAMPFPAMGTPGQMPQMPVPGQPIEGVPAQPVEGGQPALAPARPRIEETA